MKRKAIKTVDNSIQEFIPEEYKEFDTTAAGVYERPLIIKYKKLTREQRYSLHDIDNISIDEKNLVNKGVLFKRVWDMGVTGFKNLIVTINGKEETIEDSDDKKWKEILWDKAEAFDSEIVQTIREIVGTSKLDEEEEKN